MKPWSKVLVSPQQLLALFNIVKYISIFKIYNIYKIYYGLNLEYKIYNFKYIIFIYVQDQGHRASGHWTESSSGFNINMNKKCDLILFNLHIQLICL